MKLGDLLLEQKDGEEALLESLQKKKLDEASIILEKNTDEDFGIITTSTFLSEAISKLPEGNQDIVSAFKNIAESFEKIESKKTEKGFVPKVFGRIQLDYIKESYEIIQEELENPKTLKQFDKEELIKALAFVKFSSNLIAEESKNNTFFLEDFDNSILNEAVIKQEDVLKTVFTY